MHSPTSETKGYSIGIANLGVDGTVLDETVRIEPLGLWVVLRIAKHVPRYVGG